MVEQAERAPAQMEILLPAGANAAPQGLLSFCTARLTPPAGSSEELPLHLFFPDNFMGNTGQFPSNTLEKTIHSSHGFVAHQSIHPPIELSACVSVFCFTSNRPTEYSRCFTGPRVSRVNAHASYKTCLPCRCTEERKALMKGVSASSPWAAGSLTQSLWACHQEGLRRYLIQEE